MHHTLTFFIAVGPDTTLIVPFANILVLILVVKIIDSDYLLLKIIDLDYLLLKIIPGDEKWNSDN